MNGVRPGSAAQGFTSVEVDSVLLERARVALGVRTARRTVELALREVIHRDRNDPDEVPEAP